MPMVAFLNVNGSYTNENTFAKSWELYDGTDASPRDTIFNFINNCRSTLKTFTLSECHYDEGSPALSGSLANLFQGCRNLTAVNFLCKEGNITNTSDMFSGCINLTTITMPDWTMSNVINISHMFFNNYNLTSLDVSNWNTNNVMNMSNIFSRCRNLTSLNVSNWSTNKVTDMGGTFDFCHKLTSLDVSNWNTNNVMNMSNMFSYCNDLTSLDVSNWSTNKVTDMHYMFYACYDLVSLNISNWNVNNVTNMWGMFRYCENLKTIYINSNNWQLNSSLNSGSMFLNCDNLIGRKGTTYISSKTDASYARIDGGPDLPGYFCGVYNAAVSNIPIKDAYFRGQKVNKAILGRDLLNLKKADNSMFIYAGRYYSKNGISWEQTNYPNVACGGIAYGNNQVIALDLGPESGYWDNTPIKTYKSLDGINYVELSPITFASRGVVECLNGNFVIGTGKASDIMGGEYGLYKLIDNIWDYEMISEPPREGHSTESLAYIDNNYYATSTYGLMHSSTDLSSWTDLAGSSLGWSQVAGNENIIIGVAGNEIGYSEDKGITWTRDTSYKGAAICYGKDRFVMVGSGVSYYSFDGKSWTAMTGLSSSTFWDVAYGKDTFVCSTRNGEIYYSKDGETWQAATGIDETLSNCYGLCFADFK